MRSSLSESCANVCPCLQGEIGCAVTGKGFAALQATAGVDSLHAVLQHAAVFARMAPADKQRLVELLGEGCSTEGGQATPGLQHFVAFCGDGSNDVAALKVGMLLRQWLLLSYAQAGYTHLLVRWAQHWGQQQLWHCAALCDMAAPKQVPCCEQGPALLEDLPCLLAVLTVLHARALYCIVAGHWFWAIDMASQHGKETQGSLMLSSLWLLCLKGKGDSKNRARPI